ncbi:MAG: CHAP domain-containing protein [Flavobacteriales bacterium]
MNSFSLRFKALFSVGIVLFSSLILFLSSYFFNIPFKLINEGEVLDQLDGVEVYFNGSSNHIDSRNSTVDGYNIGLRWQCVEFVKRYYLEVYSHKMPNSYGNAVDYFDSRIEDGSLSPDRALIQCYNPSSHAISKGDILIFSGGYGHVAIVSQVLSDQIEIVQQNIGKETREILEISRKNDSLFIHHNSVLGWLSRPN